MIVKNRDLTPSRSANFYLILPSGQKFRGRERLWFWQTQINQFCWLPLRSIANQYFLKREIEHSSSGLLLFNFLMNVLPLTIYGRKLTNRKIGLNDLPILFQWSFFQIATWTIVLCLSTRSQKGGSKNSPAVKLFLRAYHYVGHCWWSLVTRD